jgi:hypothetical protein
VLCPLLQAVVYIIVRLSSVVVFTFVLVVFAVDVSILLGLSIDAFCSLLYLWCTDCCCGTVGGCILSEEAHLYFFNG